MGGGTQQTTSTVKPPEAFKDILNTLGDDALRAYKGGYGSNIYTGSTVVPFSRQTTQAMTGLTQTANKNINNQGGLNSNLQGIIRNGGFNNQQQSALDRMRGQINDLGGNGLSGAQDRILGRFQSQLQSLGGNGLTNVQDQSLKNYQTTANGNYDLNANPGSQGVLDSILRKQADQVNLNAASAGRYGSGMHEGVLAREAGDTTNQYITNDYNNWLNRRDSANAAMANLGQQGLSNIQTVGGNISNLGQQGINNLGTATGNLFNAAQAGLGNMNTAYQGMRAPYTDLLGVGAQNEDLYNRQLNDKLRIWNSQNSQPWDQLSRLTSILSGGQPYSTQVQTSPGPNPLLTGLGTAATGVGLLGTLGIL